MTIREAQAEGSARLKAAGIDSPALDAALLLAEVLHTDRAGLIIRAPESISEDLSQKYAALLERRVSGECTAYILGRREFRGLDFVVNPAVLVPRPDTETLMEAALDWVDRTEKHGGGKPLEVLELCTGSGAVAISLKHERPFLSITASDISPEALDTAGINAVRLLPAPVKKLYETNFQENPGGGTIRFILSDLFEHIPGKFDLIIANPPYIPTAEITGLALEVRREPRLALDGGEDGLDLIRRIIVEAPKHLNPGGGLLLEADPRQMGTIGALLKAAGCRAIETRRDLAGRERVIGGLHYQ